MKINWAKSGIYEDNTPLAKTLLKGFFILLLVSIIGCIPVVIFYYYRDKIMLFGLLVANLIDLDHIYCRIIGKVGWFESACGQIGKERLFIESQLGEAHLSSLLEMQDSAHFQSEQAVVFQNRHDKGKDAAREQESCLVSGIWRREIPKLG